MINLSADDLKILIIKILEKRNVSVEVAQKVAASLVLNELAGYPSHGILRILTYVKDIASGALDVHAVPVCEQESSQILNLNGNRAFGVLVTELIIEVLSKHGSQQAFCGLKVTNAHHIGRLNSVGLSLARQPSGLFVMGFCNYLGTGAHVAPPGISTTARLCTNPMLFAIPSDPDAPFVLDISTSTVAEGYVASAKMHDKSLPEGILVDETQQNSCNPDDLYTFPPKANLTSLGYPLVAHKGYGLAVFVEAIVGALAGASNITAPNHDGGNGLFILTLNPSFFGQPETIHELSASIIQASYSAGNNFRYPGQQSYLMAENKTVTIAETLYNKLKQLL